MNRSHSVLIEQVLTDDALICVFDVLACNHVSGVRINELGFTHKGTWRLDALLQCRLVSTRWKNLSKKPNVAVGLIEAIFAEGTVREGGRGLVREMVLTNFVYSKPDFSTRTGAEFLMSCHENELRSGMRATREVCAASVLQYFDDLRNQGNTDNFMIVCSASQRAQWQRELSATDAEPIMYTGKGQQRYESWIRVARQFAVQPKPNLFLAEFGALIDECHWLNYSEHKKLLERPDLSVIILDARSASGLALASKLLDAIRSNLVLNREPQIHMLLSPDEPLPDSSFQEVFELGSLLWFPLFADEDAAADEDNDNKKRALLVSLLECANIFSFGDRAVASWGLNSFLAPLMASHIQKAIPQFAA